MIYNSQMQLVNSHNMIKENIQFHEPFSFNHQEAILQSFRTVHAFHNEITAVSLSFSVEAFPHSS